VSGWLALLAAGLLEIAWAFGLKYSDGLTRFWPTAATLIAIVLIPFPERIESRNLR
jgi:quaternary ammonium compound-resistance protein SugE